MRELRGEPELSLEQALARLSPCDIALVEGYKTYPIPKLEIWRAAVGKPLLHPRDPHILAIATDSPQALSVDSIARLPVLGLGEYDAVATFVLAHAIEARMHD
jgi:molybdopterin-guanine dinucleotide biosynthesis protein B